MSDTGNGATLVLSVTGAVGNIRNIGEIAEELGKLEDSHLGTVDKKTYIPDDLAEPGEVEFEVEFNANTALPSTGVIETCTITYPVRPSGATAASHAGTGFLTRVPTPQLANGQIQVTRMRFAFNGKTGPAFTAGT
jgi:hypothetical protein